MQTFADHGIVLVVSDEVSVDRALWVCKHALQGLEELREQERQSLRNVSADDTLDMFVSQEDNSLRAPWRDSTE